MGRVLMAVGILLGCLLLLPSGGSGARTRTSGTLQLRGKFTDTFVDCPSGQSADKECFTVAGKSVVPGLGKATIAWNWIADVSGGYSCQHFDFTTIVVKVAGKGEIDASLTDPKTHCWGLPPAVYGPFEGTITGGSGSYAGASGHVQIAENMTDELGGAGDIIETWVGTLSVPGLDFSLTPPTLYGVHNRTMRARKAKRVRVRYTVTARDTAGRAVPVTCAPRSDSFFKRGATKVACSATDADGNTATATFVVTIRR